MATYSFLQPWGLGAHPGPLRENIVAMSILHPTAAIFSRFIKASGLTVAHPRRKDFMSLPTAAFRVYPLRHTSFWGAKLMFEAKEGQKAYARHWREPPRIKVRDVAAGRPSRPLRTDPF